MLNWLDVYWTLEKLGYIKMKIVQVKRLTLEEPENKCTEEGVDRVISRIERSFGHLKVKMVTSSILMRQNLNILRYKAVKKQTVGTGCYKSWNGVLRSTN